MDTPFLIAEIGINHNGSVEIAKRLIDMAIRCGADAVKFQKRTIDLVYTPEFLASPRESPWGNTMRHEKVGREFSEIEYDEIDRYCKGKIDWFASAWDIESLHFLRKYDLKYNKIASKMLADKKFVGEVAGEGKHTFISTGLNDAELIDWAVFLFDHRNCPFTLLHCVMKYPCPLNECALNKITELKERYNCPVGYSSHFPGILDKSIAVVLGANVIEAHITLDRSNYGTDQPASLEERGLYLVVRDCKVVRSAL